MLCSKGHAVIALAEPPRWSPRYAGVRSSYIASLYVTPACIGDKDAAQSSSFVQTARIKETDTQICRAPCSILRTLTGNAEAAKIRTAAQPQERRLRLGYELAASQN